MSQSEMMHSSLSLPDGSPAHRACSDTNGLRQKAQRQHMGLLSLHNGSPLGDRSPSHCACSDTNGLRHEAQHQHQHIWLVLTHNVGLFNVIFNNVVNGLNVNIWGLS